MLFCGLAFALFWAHLRSFARICVFLRTTAFRTSAFGNCRVFQACISFLGVSGRCKPIPPKFRGWHFTPEILGAPLRKNTVKQEIADTPPPKSMGRICHPQIWEIWASGDIWPSNKQNPTVYWGATLSCPFMASNNANSYLVPISFWMLTMAWISFILSRFTGMFLVL